MQRLHELSLPDLTERLIDIAQKARRHAEEGEVVALHDLLAEVRESADEASGPACSLLQVAEAHLRAIARSDLGPASLVEVAIFIGIILIGLAHAARRGLLRWV